MSISKENIYNMKVKTLHKSALWKYHCPQGDACVHSYKVLRYFKQTI